MSGSLFLCHYRKACLHACVRKHVSMPVLESMFPCPCQKACFHASFESLCPCPCQEHVSHVSVRKPVFIPVSESPQSRSCRKACFHQNLDSKRNLGTQSPDSHKNQSAQISPYFHFSSSIFQFRNYKKFVSLPNKKVS